MTNDIFALLKSKSDFGTRRGHQKRPSVVIKGRWPSKKNVKAAMDVVYAQRTSKKALKTVADFYRAMKAVADI